MIVEMGIFNSLEIFLCPFLGNILSETKRINSKDIFFYSLFCSYLLWVPIIVEGTVYFTFDNTSMGIRTLYLGESKINNEMHGPRKMLQSDWPVICYSNTRLAPARRNPIVIVGIIILVPWESMAAPRTVWQLFLKFGTLIKDSPFLTHTESHVSH